MIGTKYKLRASIRECTFMKKRSIERKREYKETNKKLNELCEGVINIVLLDTC